MKQEENQGMVHDHDVDHLWRPIEAALLHAYERLLQEEEGPPRQTDDECEAAMNSYQLVYNAVSRTNSAEMRDSLIQRMKQWLPTVLRGRATLGSTSFVVSDLLRSYRVFSAWLQYCTGALHYLERAIAKVNSPQQCTIERLFLEAYQSVVYRPIKAHLFEAIMSHVDTCRKEPHRACDPVIASSATLFYRVGTAAHDPRRTAHLWQIYRRDFLDGYVETLSTSLRRDTLAALGTEGGHVAYLAWAERRLELELSLIESLIEPFGREELRVIARQELVGKHYEAVVGHADAGCAGLIRDSKADDLARMHRLLTLVPEQLGLVAMGEGLQARVTEDALNVIKVFEGTVAKQAIEADKLLICGLLELNKQYENLIEERLGGNGLFSKYRRRGLKAAVNRGLTRRCQRGADGAVVESATSFSAVIAAFLDALLRRELGDVAADPEAEQRRLDGLLTLVTLIRDKDVMQQLYQERMAKRLLQTTPDEELENEFVERLKRELGAGYTNKMVVMLRDSKSALDVSMRFQQQDQDVGDGFEVRLLTEACWPTYRGTPLTPPAALRQHVDAFERFYKSMNPTRRLRWVAEHGHAQLQLQLPGGKKDVTVAVAQACILLLLGEATAGMSLSGLAAALDVAPAALKPYAASMTSGKYALLRRGGTVRMMDDTEVLTINTGFTHPARKFRLPVPSVKEHEDDTASQLTDERRKLQTESAIVRIMKSRRTLTYTQLQESVVAMLSKLFVPQPRLIKRCIEDLLEREYLKRCDAEHTLLEYVA